MPCFFVGRTFLSVILSRDRAPSAHFRSSIFDLRKLQPAPLQPVLRSSTPFPYSFTPAFTPLLPRFSTRFFPPFQPRANINHRPASTYAPPQIFFSPAPSPPDSPFALRRYLRPPLPRPHLAAIFLSPNPSTSSPYPLSPIPGPQKAQHPRAEQTHQNAQPTHPNPSSKIKNTFFPANPHTLFDETNPPQFHPRAIRATPSYHGHLARAIQNPICANLHHLRHLRPLFNPYWNNFGASSFRYCRQLIHVCPPPLVWNWWLMLCLASTSSNALAPASVKSLSPTLIEKILIDLFS